MLMTDKKIPSQEIKYKRREPSLDNTGFDMNLGEVEHSDLRTSQNEVST